MKSISCRSLVSNQRPPAYEIHFATNCATSAVENFRSTPSQAIFPLDIVPDELFSSERYPDAAHFEAILTGNKPEAREKVQKGTVTEVRGELDAEAGDRDDAAAVARNIALLRNFC